MDGQVGGKGGGGRGGVVGHVADHVGGGGSLFFGGKTIKKEWLGRRNRWKKEKEIDKILCDYYISAR